MNIKSEFVKAAEGNQDLLSIAKHMTDDGYFDPSEVRGKPLSAFNGKSFKQVDKIIRIGFKWEYLGGSSRRLIKASKIECKSKMIL